MHVDINKNKRTRILHAYKCYHPQKGGIPTIIQLVAEGLQTSTEHEVLCTHQKWFGATETINHVNVHRLASLGNLFSLPVTPHYPAALWKLAGQFDLLHYHFPMPWVDLAVACYLPKSLQLIVHWHSEIIRQKKLAHVLGPIIHRCLQRADRIIIADETHIDHSLWLPAYRDKCHVIPYGIDLQSWQKVSATEAEKIQQLQKKHKPFVLAVGRLVSYKGFSTLIAAMRSVDAKLIIVGEGPLEKELKQLVEKLQLTQQVYFYGNANQSELKCLYHAADLFVLPSISENEAFGMVQLEAMACGKPIVNTALHSAVPNVARHQKEALTVPPGSVESLANAMNQILNHPEMAEKFANNGRKRAEMKYSLENFLAETENLYHSMLFSKRKCSESLG